MKNKSFKPFETLRDAAKKPLTYGQVIFESYWKKDKNGNIEESQPVTSEFLTGFFWPVEFNIDQYDIRIGALSTGFKLEVNTDLHGVTTERIVFKPVGITGDLAAESWRLFNKNFVSNNT